MKAFEQWLKYLDETNELYPPTPIYSYHASKYLSETRSLIWFAVRNGKYDLTDEERTEILVLLQEEVTAACKCQNDILYPQDEPNLSCDEDKYQGLMDEEVRLVSVIYECEKILAEYILIVFLYLFII